MKNLFIALASLVWPVLCRRRQRWPLRTAVWIRVPMPSTKPPSIRNVIADESDAFFTENREKWFSHWAHEPYVSWTAQGGAASILTQAGWDAYSGMFEGYFDDPTPGPATTIRRAICRLRSWTKPQQPHPCKSDNVPTVT
ncbi:hypothetical protein [Spirosoma fluminis]